MNNSLWLLVCFSSLMVMLAIVIRWYMLRKALLNPPTLLEQQQQVFAVTPFSSSIARHGLGGYVPHNRCPVVIQSSSSSVTFNHSGNAGYVNHTVIQSTSRVSGPPTYEQAVAAANNIPKNSTTIIPEANRVINNINSTTSSQTTNRY